MLLASGLCPDWEDWDPKKAKQNAQEAMDAAEKWLDVPQVNTFRPWPEESVFGGLRTTQAQTSLRIRTV